MLEKDRNGSSVARELPNLLIPVFGSVRSCQKVPGRVGSKDRPEKPHSPSLKTYFKIHDFVAIYVLTLVRYLCLKLKLINAEISDRLRHIFYLDSVL